MSLKPKSPKKLITINEALEQIETYYGRPMYSSRTIYNRIASKKLKRYGPRHEVLLDQSEVQRTMMIGGACEAHANE